MKRILFVILIGLLSFASQEPGLIMEINDEEIAYRLEIVETLL